MLKTKGDKILCQPSLRMNAKEDGNTSLETYTFDQEVARREFGNMLVLYVTPTTWIYLPRVGARLRGIAA